MHKKTNIVRTFSLLLMAGGLASCGFFGGEQVEIRAVEKLPGLSTAQNDIAYESAVSAINRKEYARALEYLHDAVDQNPRNVKALNALGVVYDKLGRFDLSARYYARARDADPNSPIVTENIAYSKYLQGLSTQEPKSAPETKSVPAKTVASVSTVPAAVPIPRPKPEQAARPRATASATPRLLKVVNASGSRNATKVIATRLKSLSWTLRQSENGNSEARTILLYAPGKLKSARAMKRTLPFPVRIVADTSGYSGLQLIVGQDYLTWKPKTDRMARWKTSALTPSAAKL